MFTRQQQAWRQLAGMEDWGDAPDLAARSAATSGAALAITHPVQKICPCQVRHTAAPMP